MACAWCIPELDLILMTPVAGNTNMLSRKLEICILVLKGVLIEGNTVVLSPLVFFMTTLAIGPHDRRGLTMKACVLITVQSDVFMTVDAQGVLRGFIKAAVADFAVFFLLGMSFNYRPWHQYQGLEIQPIGKNRK